MNRFKDLFAWQFSTKLKEAVFEFTARPHVASNYDFCKDIRRSARSAPANLSEGFGRLWPRDNAKFVRNAMGSLAETQNHLRDALKERYINDEEFREMFRHARRAAGASKRWHDYLMSCPPGDPSKWMHKPGNIVDNPEGTPSESGAESQSVNPSNPENTANPEP